MIVRGAFPGEDAVLRSAAGLSETVAGCRSVEEIEAAIHEIHARCHDRAVVQYFGAPPAAADPERFHTITGELDDSELSAVRAASVKCRDHDLNSDQWEPVSAPKG